MSDHIKRTFPSDDELLRRAVRGVLPRPGKRSDPRWVCVMYTFVLGSAYARELCKRFGFDPDEEVKR